MEHEDVQTVVADKKDISSETVLADLQARMKQLEDFNALKDNTIAEKNQLLEEQSKKLESELRNNTKLKNENNWLNKTLEEMRERVECQVCLLLPQSGPVPMCPNGHFICTSCKGRRRQEGKDDCPTCKEPLGEIKSLLAKTVIENVKHECDLEGCKKMIDHSEIKNHKKMCEFRLVRCPGENCEVMLAFNLAMEHIRGCKDNRSVMEVERINGNCVLIQEISKTEILKKNNVTWQTVIKKLVNNETMFLRMRKMQNVFEMEVVMKGSEKECQKYKADITIYDTKTGEIVLHMCHSPRPISTLEWGPVRLLVSQDTLASLWKLDKEDSSLYVFNIGFEISEKIL